MTNINLTISSLHKAYANGDLTPQVLIQTLLEQAKNLTAVWIHLLSEEEIAPYLDNLKDKSPETHPLYGVPFAIKDNMDLAGIETTAGCPAFAYTPDESAFAIKKLIAAGAIPLGKTNLDQFATGLVGTRSPYGATPNSFNPDYISGGSSSGSAVATAKGVVTFALGTDTAGSGRVPACFNNLVGLKPTKGLLSNKGMVPACQSIDCISIFALTTADTKVVFEVAANYDETDTYSRKNIAANQSKVIVNKNFTFAVPLQEQLTFFGSEDYQQMFTKAVAHLETLGGTKVELDYSPFLSAAELLYEGPWVAERYHSTKTLIEEQPEAMFDVTRTIISGGNKPLAIDAFDALYKLQDFKKQADKIISQVDFMISPTAGRHFTLAEIAEEPILRNSQLGYYTNFMNLLDYTALAIPTGFTDKNMPFGITLFSDAMSDQKLLAYGERIEYSTQLTLGATPWKLPEKIDQSKIKVEPNSGFVDVVVCGAHLTDMALNWQLTERNAVLLEETKTAEKYQMFAVQGQIERPAMIRNEDNGKSFIVEVWRLPVELFGSFVASIAQPLGIGKLELIDGRWLTGFIAEGYAMEGKNISQYSGWREYKNNT